MPEPFAPDRRSAARLTVHRPIKLRCADTGHHLAGRTRNLSGTGALLELEARSRLAPGHRVAIGIPEHDRQALLAADELRPARVVRVTADGGVAVAFED